MIRFVGKRFGPGLSRRREWKGAFPLKKWIQRLAAPLGMLLLLTGCLFESGEDFYLQPQLPEDYLSLQTAINQVISDLGAEYTSPVAGDNTQNIQLHDLDGDGEEETAVAFFWVAEDEKPLKIYFFRQSADGESYETTWVIEREGTGIYTVDFCDLGGDGGLELVVSWQISTDVRAMGAYALLEDGYDVVELMYSGYTQSAMLDIDQDNETEILLLQTDTAESTGRVEMYDYSEGLMLLTAQAELSQTLSGVKAVKQGHLADLSPALFITSEIGTDGGYVTDVVAWQGDGLTNLTLDESTGISAATLRYYTDFQDVFGSDINADGVTEIPIPEELPLLSDSSRTMYQLHWYQINGAGQLELLETSLHCYDDGWYLVLPESWEGCITAARQESSNGNASSERMVTFYYIPEGDTEQAQAFLTIYRLSGTNRSYRASLSGRFVLEETSEVIYAARLWSGGWDCGVDQEELGGWFGLIQTEWSAG